MSHYPYPTTPQAAEEWPVVQRILHGDMPEPAIGAKAAHTLTGYGFSFYPGEPGVFGAEAACCEAPQGYGKADLERDLDEHFAGALAGAEGTAAASPKALPWKLIGALLMKFLMEYLNK